jgi:hypothetical protein
MGNASGSTMVILYTASQGEPTAIKGLFVCSLTPTAIVNCCIVAVPTLSDFFGCYSYAPKSYVRLLP